ncbi:hypothetical protein [Rosistilla oblonga]|uniref:hypothetical protein n=1 Tax=Rosistilla oblonga TaxID=2527990 RepID=UPI003A977D52
MKKMAFALVLLAATVGCGGSDVYDPSRVPEGATDTSDPSNSRMTNGLAPGAPKSAADGPGAK